MKDLNHWLKPEGIEDILPEEAEILQHLRTDVLNLFKGWGYELVIPPLVEYLDSLLTGTAHDLDLETFKLTDQLSGRLMGVRADMTPQIARIDAHLHNQDAAVARFCYLGTTLRARGTHLDRSRTPIQLGAELYGYPGPEADIEVIRLMLELLGVAGLNDIQFDLGHVGIYRGLVEQAGLDDEQQNQLFALIQSKAHPEITELLKGYNLPVDLQAMLTALPNMYGDQQVIAQARVTLGNASAAVHSALDELEAIASGLQRYFPDLKIHFDLAELRGYHYKTGVVFAAFVAGYGREVARGGRYDDIGKIYGTARSATGFSADLKVLARLGLLHRQQPEVVAIFAPSTNDPALIEKIRELRSTGATVVEAFPGQQIEHQAMQCTQQLVHREGRWEVVAV